MSLPQALRLEWSICGFRRKCGYQVVPMKDGLEALAAISAQSEPAIAVISSQMDGLNGLEICRATRTMNRPVYIILATERSGSEQLAAAVEAGADDHLITPFDADELRARIGVGARVIGLQAELAAVQRGLEAASAGLQTFDHGRQSQPRHLVNLSRSRRRSPCKRHRCS